MKIQELIDKTIILTDTNLNINHIKNLYNNKIDDWKKYINLKENYTRNLVFKNDKFQLIIMTWPGKFESFIHDHNKNECVFNIYKNNQDKLKLETTNQIKINQIGNINDNYGYHSVKNNSDDFAVSIHLYIKSDETKDLDQVNIFILDDKMNFNKQTIYLKYDN